MPNNFDSNITRTVADVYVSEFQAARVHTKNVDTQLFKGRFTGGAGSVVDIKRPLDVNIIRTADGDLTSIPASDIIAGKASATVQNMLTTRVDFKVADQALRMGGEAGLRKLLGPMARRIAIEMELDFSSFMFRNSALFCGTHGTAITTWDHVARAGALMRAAGVPEDEKWFMSCGPYTQTKLASQQRSMAGNDKLIADAHNKALIMENFAGMDVLVSTTLPTHTIGAGATRVGTLSANPDVTYLTCKDTMTQTFAVAGLSANTQLKAGDVMRITGRNRLNLMTHRPILDENGAAVVYTGTVAQDVTLSGTGTGNVVVTGPAIFEATGSYNSVSSAPISGDVVTFFGAAGTTHQPNLFWHKNAFSMVSIPIPKTFVTDTTAITDDGLEFRVSKYGNGDANRQTIRLDFWPAYAALDPFKAGQAYGG